MSELSKILNEIGDSILLKHSRSLLALVDAQGKILEKNERFGNSGATGLFVDLLADTNQMKFNRMLHESLHEQSDRQAVLHFAGSEAELQASYECRIFPVAGDRAVIYANLIPPIDHYEAEEYFQLTEELSKKTRELQEANEQINQKQKQLELANTKLEELAHTDELTRIPNRRRILERLEDEINRANRYRTNLAVLLLDLDHFKFVNDRYGHKEGDRVLVHSAQIFQNEVRRTDWIGRYGGEEFLGVLPETDAEAAVQLAARLRNRMQETSIPLETGVRIKITVSIGVAWFRWDVDTGESLLQRSDMALYRAKALGRDQVCLWTESRETSELEE